MFDKIRTHYWLFILVLSSVFVTCRREEPFEQREYPRLRETLVQAVDTKGATFSGTVITAGKGKIIDHGFIWKKITAFAFDRLETTNNPADYDHISLGPLTNQLSFEAVVSYGIYAKSNYTVRSYLKTDDGFTVYGQPAVFESQGASPPTITRVQPELAVWGDTITITGTNFSYLLSNVSVFFGENATARILSVTPTSIRCLVPTNVPRNEVYVTINTPSGQATSANLFKIDTNKPIVTAISPTLGTFGETITITGKNFSGSPQSYRVIFEYNRYSEVQAQVLEVRPTDIKALVPALDRKFYTVRLARVNPGGNILSDPAPDLFQMKPPKIAAVELIQAVIYKPVKVTGTGFSKPKVIFAGVEAEVDARTSTEFQFNPTEGIYPRPTSLVDLKVTSAEQEDNRQISFTYSAPWVKRANRELGPFSSGVPVAAFTLQNNGYFLVSRDTYQPVQAYRYNPQQYDWQRLPDIKTTGETFYDSNIGTFVINDQVYILSGRRFGTLSPKMWKYQPATNGWQEVNATGLPEPGSSYYVERPYVMCAIGNKGYLLTGNDNGSIYEYNAGSDTWGRKLTNLLPTSQTFSGAFVINGLLYAVGMSQNQYIATIYSYNPVTNEWQAKLNFPFLVTNYTRQCLAYDNGGLGYIVSMRETVSYDPASNTIKRLLQNTGKSGNNTASLGFSYQKNAYLMHPFLLDFWEINHEN